MKTKLYLLTLFSFLTVVVSAQVQKYNTMLFEEWTNNAWANALKTTNTYDSSGNLLTITTEVWNAETSGWSNFSTMTNTLNSDATVKETLTQTWQDNAWVDFQKTIYTYSASKKVLTETSQLLYDGLSMDFSKVTNTYNEQDSLSVRLTQNNLNPLSTQWGNVGQETYSYNADGTLNQTVSQTWSPSNVWENSMRYTNTYNNSKKVISDLIERWVVDAWVNFSKTTYTYSGELLQESIDQDWLNEQWADTTKGMFTYNTSNELQQMVFQAWNPALSQWENHYRYTYTYVSTGIAPVLPTDKAFMAFPNPFVDQITIQSRLQGEQDVEIINSSGQVVKSFKTQGKALKMDLGHLENGMYFIRMNAPEFNQSIKVLKVK